MDRASPARDNKGLARTVERKGRAIHSVDRGGTASGRKVTVWRQRSSTAWPPPLGTRV